MKLIQENKKKEIILNRLTTMGMEESINKELDRYNIMYSISDIHGLFSLMNYDLCELELSIATNSTMDITQ